MNLFTQEGLMQMLYSLPGILIGLSFHEFAHAYVAYKLGDHSQKLQGRLTLDPVAHIDPIGLLMLFLVHFGWAKPVQVNSRYFKHPKRDDILVSLAGPAMNFVVGLISGGILILIITTIANPAFYVVVLIKVLIWTLIINVGLMVFNLLPIPPLDGSHVLLNLLPPKYAFKVMENYHVINIVFIAIILFTPILGYILNPLRIVVIDLIGNIYQVPQLSAMLGF